jgi:choline kinase
MNRNTAKILASKDSRKLENVSVAILNAGVGARIKSCEPRSLIKIKDKQIIDWQLDAIEFAFEKPDVITVVGCKPNRVFKKIGDKIRIVENQLHESTNNSESLRLAFNASITSNFMFLHGDLVFNRDLLAEMDYSQSFVISDSQGMIKKNEVGLTEVNGELSVLSYGLERKWCQIAFFTGRELDLLKNIFNKFNDTNKKMLSFELINQIVSCGGKFKCFEPKSMKILEIDTIKDAKNENINL